MADYDRDFKKSSCRFAVRRRLLLAALLAAVLSGAVLFLAVSIPPTRGYRGVTASEGPFILYSRFSGTVYAPGRAVQAAGAACTIKKLYRHSGDAVKMGDAVLKTSLGQTLYAPRNGTLQGLTVAEGQPVSPGQILFTVADYRDLRIRFYVDEQEIGSIQTGSSVTIRFPAREGEWTGRISYLSQEAESTKSAPCFEVQAILSDPSGLLCGMSAQVDLEKTRLESAVLLPVEAVMTDGENRPYVYYLSGGRMAAKYIAVGESDGIHAVITRGVAPGETVYLPTGNRIRVDPMDFLREGN